jgi:hypothetical protein
MSDDPRRIRMAEDLLRHFTACARAVQLYSLEHPIVTRAVGQLSDTLERAHVEAADVVLGIVDQQVIVDGVPVGSVHGATEAVDRFRAIGIERIAFDRGVTAEELLAFVRELAAAQARRDGDGIASALSSAHIHVGRLRLQQRMESGHSDIRAIQ